MTRPLLILALVVATTFNVFAQCDVSITGYTDPGWCLPCNGSAMAVASGTAPFGISWSTGDSTFSIDSVCEGTYIVEMSDSVGCIASDTVVLTSTPALTVSITTTPATCLTCDDGCMSIIPSDGCPTYTISVIPFDPFFMPCEVTPGTYVIEVCDDCGCCIQDTVVIDTIMVGLTENGALNESHVSVYPNPTSGKINLRHQLLDDNIKITIHNVLGELVYEQPFYDTQINISYLSEGVYFLRANINGKIQTKKIVKI